MEIGKRIWYVFVGLVLLLGGIWLVTQDLPWVVDLAFGSGAVVGAGLVLRGLLGGEGSK
jgi:hypothetical protein